MKCNLTIAVNSAGITGISEPSRCDTEFVSTPHGGYWRTLWLDHRRRYQRVVTAVFEGHAPRWGRPVNADDWLPDFAVRDCPYADADGGYYETEETVLGSHTYRQVQYTRGSGVLRKWSGGWELVSGGYVWRTDSGSLPGSGWYAVGETYADAAVPEVVAGGTADDTWGEAMTFPAEAGGVIVAQWLIERSDYDDGVTTDGTPVAFSDGSLHLSREWGDTWESPIGTERRCSSRYAVGARLMMHSGTMASAAVADGRIDSLDWSSTYGLRWNSGTVRADEASPASVTSAQAGAAAVGTGGAVSDYAYIGDIGDSDSIVLELRDDGTELTIGMQGASGKATIPSQAEWDWRLAAVYVQPRMTNAIGARFWRRSMGGGNYLGPLPVTVTDEFALGEIEHASDGGTWLADDWSEPLRTGAFEAYGSLPSRVGIPTFAGLPAGFAADTIADLGFSAECSGGEISVSASVPPYTTANYTSSYTSARVWNHDDPVGEYPRWLDGLATYASAAPPAWRWSYIIPERRVVAATERLGQLCCVYVGGADPTRMLFSRSDNVGADLDAGNPSGEPVLIGTSVGRCVCPSFGWAKDGVMVAGWSAWRGEAPGANCTRYHSDNVCSHTSGVGHWPATWTYADADHGATWIENRAAVSRDCGRTWTDVVAEDAWLCMPGVGSTTATRFDDADDGQVHLFAGLHSSGMPIVAGSRTLAQADWDATWWLSGATWKLDVHKHAMLAACSGETILSGDETAPLGVYGADETSYVFGPLVHGIQLGQRIAEHPVRQWGTSAETDAWQHSPDLAMRFETGDMLFRDPNGYRAYRYVGVTEDVQGVPFGRYATPYGIETAHCQDYARSEDWELESGEYTNPVYWVQEATDQDQTHGRLGLADMRTGMRFVAAFSDASAAVPTVWRSRGNVGALEVVA